MPFLSPTSRNHLLDLIFSLATKTPEQGKGHQGFNELERTPRKKTWWDCVNNDMESLGPSQKDAQFRNKRRRIKGATG